MDASVWAASPLVVAVRLILCVFLFYFSSYVALWDSKSPHWHACERVSYCMETSPLWLPPQDKPSISKSFVSVFIFYILSYILLRQLGCLSGCLVSSDSVQKLFYGSCSEFKWFFDELVGEKVSPCLIPSPLWDCPPSGSFLINQLYASGDQILELQLQYQSFQWHSGLITFRTDWFDFLQSKRLSRVFSNTTDQKHLFFGTQPSLLSNSHILTGLLGKP